MAIDIAGTFSLCRPSGALWLAAERTLVVADLHLEKGSAYAARGQLLPPYDTGETLDRLALEVARFDPGRVVLLGDSFHDPQANARLGQADVGRIAFLAAGRNLVWILGNHDGAASAGLPGETVSALRLANLLLVHEPAGRPSPGEIAGHLHPCAKVRGFSATLRRRCFATDGTRMVLPAFGAYAGGLNVLDPAFRPLFAQRPTALVLGADRVHQVGGRSLRPD